MSCCTQNHKTTDLQVLRFDGYTRLFWHASRALLQVAGTSNELVLRSDPTAGVQVQPDAVLGLCPVDPSPNAPSRPRLASHYWSTTVTSAECISGDQCLLENTLQQYQDLCESEAQVVFPS